MKTVTRRIARLEERFAPATQDPVKKRWRMLITNGPGASPGIWQCTRFLCQDGTLMETVELDRELEFGDREKLEAWINRQPIKVLSRLLVFSLHHHDEEDSAFAGDRRRAGCRAGAALFRGSDK